MILETDFWDAKNDNSVDREIESMRRVFRRPALYDSPFVVRGVKLQNNY